MVRISRDVKVQPIPYAAPPAGKAKSSDGSGVLRRVIKTLLKGF